MSATGCPDDAHCDDVRWIGVPNARALRETAVQRILDEAKRAIEARGSFVIVLAGGNTPRSVYADLRSARTDWRYWHIYFGDERCLPVDDAGRNNRMAGEAWLDHVAIPRQQIHRIPAEQGADAAASAYAASLQNVGSFDLVVLGLGEDGHTASLFPGHDRGSAPQAPDVLAVHAAPKPPEQRVSLSAARLSRTRSALFLVAGESKRAAVAQWRLGADLPAAEIRPAAGVDVLVEARLLTGALPDCSGDM